MTNKKLKFAAMSVALTACVAAQPLAANAAENLRPVADDPAPEQNEPSEASSSSEETVEEIKNETLNPDPEGVEGFNMFMERYMKGLPIERAAVDSRIW